VGHVYHVTHGLEVVLDEAAELAIVIDEQHAGLSFGGFLSVRLHFPFSCLLSPALMRK
jgi:hypothetical protein